MTTLQLTSSLSEKIKSLIQELPAVNIEEKNLNILFSQIDKKISTPESSLRMVAKTCLAILQQNAYVHVKGFSLTEDVRDILTLGYSVGDIFGDLSHQSSVVVPASPVIGAQLQGNQTSQLFLHTDFAMLNPTPAVSIIQCKANDPLGYPYGINGITVAQKIVTKLYGSKMLDDFLNISLPFAGKTPSGDTILIEEPILKVGNPGELAQVRFHPSRIHYGFRVKKEKTDKQLEVLRNFLQVTQEEKSQIFLEKGDFLLVDNRRVLHDRGLCSLELCENGNINSRLIHVLFLKEMKKYE